MHIRVSRLAILGVLVWLDLWRNCIQIPMVSVVHRYTSQLRQIAVSFSLERKTNVNRNASIASQLDDPNMEVLYAGDFLVTRRGSDFG
ncbi:hypothetical protein V8F20_011379 [Naviculisporaceae sp. PSN 640]